MPLWAKGFWKTEYTRVVAARSDDIGLIGSISFLGALALVTLCRLRMTGSIWKRFSPALTAAAAMPLLFACAFVISKQRFECGRLISKLSAAGVQGPKPVQVAVMVAMVAQLVGLGFAAVWSTISQTRHCDRARDGSYRTSEATAWCCKVCSAVSIAVLSALAMVVMGLPAAIKAIVDAPLPTDNTWHIDTKSMWWKWLFNQFSLPALMSVSTTALAPMLADRFFAPHGASDNTRSTKGRILYLSLVLVVINFFIPATATILLDDGCEGGWAKLWLGCNCSAPEFIHCFGDSTSRPFLLP